MSRRVRIEFKKIYVDPFLGFTALQVIALNSARVLKLEFSNVLKRITKSFWSEELACVFCQIYFESSKVYQSSWRKQFDREYINFLSFSRDYSCESELGFNFAGPVIDIIFNEKADQIEVIFTPFYNLNLISFLYLFIYLGYIWT